MNAFVEPTYKRIDSEDGPYDAWWGYGVFCSTEKNGVRTYYQHDQVFDNLPEANRLLERVQSRGYIDNKYWAVLGEEPIRSWDDIEAEWNQLAMQGY